MIDLSMSSLLSGMLIGGVGAALFLYGKNTGKMQFLGAGVLMNIYPFFVASPLLLWGLTGTVLTALWVVRNA